MESFLFVFKVALERVVLLHEGAMLLGVPLSARVQFLDLAPLEAVQAVPAVPGEGAGGGRRHSVTFDGFPERHTPLFYSDSNTMIRSLQRQPLVVTLFQQHPAAPLPVVVGTARAPVSEQFCDLLSRATKCAARHPLAAVVRGEYPVCDVDEVQVGTVSLTARLVCFDGEALEQMRVERASRAESTAASVSSRRSSGPCTDDRLVTTTTNVCSKCMLPKRPPSTGAHAHTKQPSQATILEETNDVFCKDQQRQCLSEQPAPALADRPARAPTPRKPAAVTSKPDQTSAPPARISIPGQSTSPPPRLQPRLSEDLSDLGVYGRQPSRITTAPPPSGDQQQLASPAPMRALSSTRGGVEDASGDTRNTSGSAEKSAVLSGPAPAAPACAAAGPGPPAAAAPLALPGGPAIPALARVAGPARPADATYPQGGARAGAPRVIPPCVAIPSPFSDATPRGSVPSTGTARSAQAAGLKATESRHLPTPTLGVGARGATPVPGGAKAVSSTDEGAPRGARGASAATARAAEAVTSNGPAPGSRDNGRGVSSTADRTSSAAGTQAVAAASAGARVQGSEAAASDGSTRNPRNVFTWEDATHHSGAARRGGGGAALPVLASSTLLSGVGRAGRAPAADSDWRAIEKERVTTHFLKLRGGLTRASDLSWDMDLGTPLTKYGHKDCVVPPRPVPGNQGWLWNTASNNYQPRRGWYPGAIPRGIGLSLRTTRSE